MVDTVFVPYEGSQQATEAVEFAVTEFDPEQLHVLYVINPVETGYLSDVPEVDRAEAILDEARQQLADIDVEIIAAVESGRPDRKIIEYTDTHEVDIIVMGSHGREGIARVLLGSVAETVVRRASVPVCIVR